MIFLLRLAADRTIHVPDHVYIDAEPTGTLHLSSPLLATAIDVAPSSDLFAAVERVHHARTLTPIVRPVVRPPAPLVQR